MLGRNYPGYFPLFDEKALARLIEKYALNRNFRKKLKRALAARRALFSPTAEREALRLRQVPPPPLVHSLLLRRHDHSGED
jgi:hypothetical protein